MQEDLFSHILDKDETIVKAYRPNGFRAWFGLMLANLLIILFWVPFAVATFFPMGEDPAVPGVGIGALISLAIVIVLGIVFKKLWLNKTVFAVTNKRIIIRTGYIGVDYKSLDFAMVGAIVVNVSWVDKLLRKNTGRVSFGSTASPMVNGANSNFNFFFIKQPYECYREIKEIIEDYKVLQNKK